ncbi:hypothetical protein J7J18_01530 [bacterium]|nr:hypothetical protein [bacterium]
MAFRVSDLSESVRENFIGVVIWAEYPCNCRVCEEGKRRLLDMGRQPRTDKRIHIAIKPITSYEKIQHTWYTYSRTYWSTFGAFVIALDRLGIIPPENLETEEEQWQWVRENLLGKAFEFTSVQPVKFVQELTGKTPPAKLPAGLVQSREIWLPIRKVEGKELESYGITDLDSFYKQARDELISFLEGGSEISEEVISDYFQ